VKSPKDRGDSGVPGEPVLWTVWPEKGWPAAVEIEVSVLYAISEPREASLRVMSGNKTYDRE